MSQTQRHTSDILWMRDGLRCIDPAGFVESVEVDMTQVRALLSELKLAGSPTTYTHFFVRSVAEVLARNPDLNVQVNDRESSHPDQVDIGISVSGASFVSPILLIPNAANKSLAQIADEMRSKAPAVRDAQRKFLDSLRRWGGLVPFGWLRRWFISRKLRQLSSRQKDAGSFQISCLSEVDRFAPLLFVTPAILGIGRVKERPAVVGGTVMARPTVVLTLAVDHKVWDGVTAARLLTELSRIVASDKEELRSLLTSPRADSCQAA